MSHGVFLAIERMGRSRGGKGGRIVNISSVAGLSVRFSFLLFDFFLRSKHVNIFFYNNQTNFPCPK